MELYEEPMPEKSEKDYTIYFISEELSDYENVNKIMKKGESFQQQALITNLEKYLSMRNDNNYDVLDSIEKTNPFELNYENLKQIINASFKKFKTAEQNVISIKEELIPFMKSCGNVLNQKEVEFFCFIVGKKEKISVEDLYKVCGTILQFREKKNREIINEVFDYYYKEQRDIFPDKKNLQLNNIEVTYNDEIILKRKTNTLAIFLY